MGLVALCFIMGHSRVSSRGPEVCLVRYRRQGRRQKSWKRNMSTVPLLPTKELAHVVGSFFVSGRHIVCQERLTTFLFWAAPPSLGGRRTGYTPPPVLVWPVPVHLSSFIFSVLQVRNHIVDDPKDLA